TAMVIVEPLPAVSDAGLKDAVTPAGRPAAESATVCAVPLVTAVEMAIVPLLPPCTEIDCGLALMEKSLSAKAASTLVSEARVKVQLVEELEHPPVNPEKLEPESGTAVSVMLVPAANSVEQLAPQLIPAGLEVTVPVPVPDLLTVAR